MNIGYYGANFTWKIVRFIVMDIMGNKHPVNKSIEHTSLQPNIEIIQIPTLWDNYTYLISNGEEAVVFDPPDTKAIANELHKRNLVLKQIIITHHHPDHIGGVLWYKKHYNAKVIGPKDKRIPGIDKFVVDNDSINFSDLEIQVISVPGHTTSHVVYYCKKLNMLISGDTIFSCGCGKLFEGVADLMFQSLQKLRTLPLETNVFCGHEYTLENVRFSKTLGDSNIEVEKRIANVKRLLAEKLPTVPSTLGMELKTNPFIRWDNPQLKNSLGLENKSDLQVFIHTRELKNVFNKKKKK